MTERDKEKDKRIKRKGQGRTTTKEGRTQRRLTEMKVQIKAPEAYLALENAPTKSLITTTLKAVKITLTLNIIGPTCTK